jgi:hypothetical protein
MATMSTPFDPLDALFQVGEDKYGYKYRPTNMHANASPVYQCIRCTDPNCMVKCLWLYKSVDGHWIATEAPKTSDDPINGGMPTFRTAGPVENICRYQTLDWQYFKTRTLEWSGALTFVVYPFFLSSRSDGLHSERYLPSTPTSEPSGTRGDWSTTYTGTAESPVESSAGGWSFVASANITESQQHDHAW